MKRDAKPRKPKVNTIQKVVAGALPALAHLLHPSSIDAESSWVDVSYPPRQDVGDPDAKEWVAVSPITAFPTRDFPMLPAVDWTRSSATFLGSLVSSFKSIPNLETWPMTSSSVGLSNQEISGDVTFRVRAQDLSEMWASLPGTGGTVLSLQWRKDVEGVSHESVVLQVAANGSQVKDWWICLERFPDGDFATLSPNPARVIRPRSAIRAEMVFLNGLSFGHVLRVLKIIHDVSRDYFLIGANCWFYASIIVEMLNIDLDNHGSHVEWLGGKSLTYCDHHTTKELNHKQHHQISSRVRELAGYRRPNSAWTSMLSTT